MTEENQISTKERRPIVETESIKDIGKKIISAIRNDDWLIITGESGSGKNTAMRYHLDSLKNRKDYLVLEITGMPNNYRDMTGSIMRMCVKAMLPSERVAQDPLARYTQFKRGLLHSKRENRKLILVIDEAQRLNKDTIYGLKMMHEAGQDYQREYLFTIITFGHPYLLAKTDSPELSFRIRRYAMQRLSHQEVGSILSAYNYSYTTSVLRSFAEASGYIPMGVTFNIQMLKEKCKLSGGEITEQSLFSLTGGNNLKQKMERDNMSNQKVATLYTKKTGEFISASMVSKVKNEKEFSPKATRLSRIYDNLITENNQKELEQINE